MARPDGHAATPAPAGDAARVLTDFLPAMSAAASGVTVVATDGPGGRFGQTVSAMCSVSADPPLVLVCLHGRSPANAAIAANGVFCVNVLATQHDHVADTFAGRPWAGKDRWDFSCGYWGVAPSGAPRITDAIASFDCAVEQVIEAGTHIVYIGRVRVVQAAPGTPLIYLDRAYWRPETFEPSTFTDFPEARPHHLASSTSSTSSTSSDGSDGSAGSTGSTSREAAR